ncbi:MAG: cache domain-containing protein [Treponema sp.]
MKDIPPIGVLSVSVPAQLLNDIVKDITVGHTGYCYSIGGTGTTIAHKNTDRVLKALNMIEAAKQDDSLRSLASFVTNALHTADSSVGYYSYKGDSVIGAFSKIKTAGWTVIVRSPVKEFRASLKTRLDF